MSYNLFQQRLPTAKSPSRAKKEKAITQVSIEENIFKSSHYGALTLEAQQVVFDYVQGQGTARPQFQTRAIYHQRRSLAETIVQYEARLEEINFKSAMFHRLNDVEKTAIAQDLYFALYIFAASRQLDEVEKRNRHLNLRREQINQCAKLLNALRNTLDKTTFDKEQKARVDDSEKPAKYLGSLILAPIIAETVEKISSGDLVDTMCYVNNMRLYWVWGRSMLDTFFSLMAATTAQQTLAIPSPVTGYMSFVLYYARGAIPLLLLLKHTISGPWMSEQERKIPWYERLTTQWRLRKFDILNDWIWATANMACYFWLIGDGLLGFWGNAATAILLLMDVSLNAWRFAEEEANHRRDMEKYARDLQIINQKITACEASIIDLQQQIKKADDAQKMALQQQLIQRESDLILLKRQRHQILRTKRQCQTAWHDKQTGLYYDFIYSVGLLIAFCMMCGLFLPVGIMPAATALFISVVGATLCFVLTVIYSSMKSSIEVRRTQQQGALAQKEYNQYLKDFNCLLTELEQLPKTSEYETEKARLEFRLQQYYLDLIRLRAKSTYQQELYAFQKLQLLYNTFVNAFVPALVFVAIMFMPFPATASVIAAGFAFVLVADKMWSQYTPKKSTWLYEVQCGQPSLDSMAEQCFYVYLHKNEIHCACKNAKGELETFTIPSKTLGSHANDIQQALKKTPPKLTQAQKKQILSAAEQQGYDFNIPSFNSQKYEQFKSEARKEYAELQADQARGKPKGLFSSAKPMDAPSSSANMQPSKAK